VVQSDDDGMMRFSSVLWRRLGLHISVVAHESRVDSEKGSVIPRRTSP
jgi:hypothetical protein